MNHKQYIKALAPLDEQDSLELIQSAVLKHYDGGRVIEDEVDKFNGVYFILSGVVKISRFSIATGISTMALLGEGRKVGLEEQLKGIKTTRKIIAVTDVSVLYFSNQLFETLFLKNEKYLKSVMKWLCDELEQREQRILNFLKNEVPGRLAKILTNEAFKNKNVFLAKELNIEDMALLCGTNKVYLSNSIKKLAQAKILDYNKTRLIVLNSTELKKLIKP